MTEGRRKQLLGLWRGATFASIVLWIHPVNGGVVRLAWLVALVGALVLAFVLWPRSWAPRGLAAALVLGGAALLFLPGKGVEGASLRRSSVEALQAYEGTPYVWGGESGLGIDCSGLVRQALIRASLREGIGSLNGDLVRSAVDQWWFDASAKALRDGYRGSTCVVGTAPSVNAASVEHLRPGDFAVTSDGVHVLAYLGSRRWIEADPELRRVVVVETPAQNPWFGVPVHLLRWRTLGACD